MENNFTIGEIEELKHLLEKGANYIQLPKEQFQLAQILKRDNNGNWEFMQDLSKDTTSKLQHLYKGTFANYSFRMIGLKHFIENVARL